jgi:hypothetical protein
MNGIGSKLLAVVGRAINGDRAVRDVPPPARRPRPAGRERREKRSEVHAATGS